jgi:hypothetical protein
MLVHLQHRHAEYGASAFRLYQLKSKIVDWIAVAQTLARSRQVGFGQLPLRLHRVELPLRRWRDPSAGNQ